MKRYVDVLKNRGYRWFWLGLTVNFLGSQVGSLGLAWFVKEESGSALAVSSVMSLSTVLLAVGALFAGPLLDRGSRRGWMTLDNLLRGLLSLALPALYWAGWLHLWQIYVAVALMGLFSSATTVGRSAITPALVEPEQLPAANALNEMQWRTAVLAGPALGGLLIARFHPMWVVVIDGLSFLFFAVALRRLPARVDEVRKGTASYWGALREGFGWLAGSRTLMALTANTFLLNLFYGPLPVALVFYVDRQLGAGSGALGLIWSAFAAGTVAGGFLGGMAGHLPAGRAVAAMTGLWGLLTAPLVWVHSLPAAMLLMFLGGFAWAPYNVIVVTARQRVVPPEAYGRVFGLMLVVTQLGAPLGGWAGGFLVGRLGPGLTMAVAGAACVVLGAVSWFSPALRRLDRLNKETALT